MAGLVKVLANTNLLLKSDFLRSLVGFYLLILMLLFLSFINIYSMDKYEFQKNKQKCFEFKHKMFFIIMYSKEKHIVSQKTFILEIVGFFLAIITTMFFFCSLKQCITLALVLLVIDAVLVVLFGGVVVYLYQKTKKEKI